MKCHPCPRSLTVEGRSELDSGFDKLSPIGVTPLGSWTPTDREVISAAAHFFPLILSRCPPCFTGGGESKDDPDLDPDLDPDPDRDRDRDPDRDPDLDLDRDLDRDRDLDVPLDLLPLHDRKLGSERGVVVSSLVFLPLRGGRRQKNQ
jgi:hypothetical protein